MSDSHLTRSERVRTPSILAEEKCECRNSSEHRCTDKVIRCQARMTWHFERGWPDNKTPNDVERAKRKKYGIEYDARGRRLMANRASATTSRPTTEEK